MPVIKRFGAIKICIFPNDHAPTTFSYIECWEGNHGTHRRYVSDSKQRPHAEIGQALEWAKDNKAILLIKWNEQNKRG